MITSKLQSGQFNQLFQYALSLPCLSKNEPEFWEKYISIDTHN